MLNLNALLLCLLLVGFLYIVLRVSFFVQDWSTSVWLLWSALLLVCQPILDSAHFRSRCEENELLGDSPVTIVMFHTQQMFCVRDIQGAVMVGGQI